MLKLLGLAACCVLAAPPVLAATPSNVAVLQHDGSSYARFVRGVVNSAPREAAALQFYRTHRDAYDFIVVFPAFDAQLAEQKILGLHTPVRNDALGTGHPVFDAGANFGSRSRLKGYIDIGSLAPGAADSSIAT
ncbi:MAG TPA: hypothetical protein VE964_11950, partial [Myxococcales bacterium]|nr:hypothetical protein [Myxococcales bacterium]